MRITLHHRLRFQDAQALQFVRGSSGLPMPCGKGVPQVMPAEINYSDPLQSIAPRLSVGLDDWTSLVSKNMGQVIAPCRLSTTSLTLTRNFQALKSWNCSMHYH